VDIDAIKQVNPVEDVISETYSLRGRGRYLRAEAHDSLVVDLYNQAYFWNSQGEQGDVITWVQKRRNLDFKGAVIALAQRGGLPEPQWGNEDAQAVAARRGRYDALTVAARHFVRCLRDNDAAQDYCRSRGWSDETIQKASLGFVDGDRTGLQGAFSMHEIDAGHPAAQAVLGISGGMLVYPHVEHGRVVYLAARSIEGKRHYNPPVELVGERRLYFNWEYNGQADQVVVVEGQADAVTLAQWEIPAIALAGVAVNQTVLKVLARHKRVYVALDPDEAGTIAARKMAEALGPLARIVSWPDKDANAWLQAGATADECQTLLATAPMWVEVLAREAGQAGQADNGQRPDALRRVFRTVARLDEFDRATYRKELADLMGLGLREFDGMLKATQPEEDSAAEEPLITITIVGGQIQMKDGDDYYLLETLYRPPEGSAGAAAVSGGKTLFAMRSPDGQIGTAIHLDLDGIRYVPPPPESQMLTKRVISFAQNIGPLLTTGDLVEEVRQIVHKYVDVDPFFEKLSAYYVLFTWMYDCFNTIAYLRFRGDYGTGKSRARKVIGGLCFRPMRASGAATVSPIFRMIDAWRGTLLVEEADYGASDYAQEIIKIYNQGYDREQGVVLRSGDKNTGFETEAFVCFGPKILAMRGEFKDPALTSRFLTKEMGGPTTRTDIPIEMPREFELEEAPRLRGMLLRYRLEHWRPYIELNYEALDMSIEPRLNQIVLALYSLVDDPELLAELQEFVREYNKRLIEERGLTLVSKVLEGLVVQYHLNQTAAEAERDLSTLRITERVNQLIDFENHGYDDYLAKHLATDNKVTDRKVGSMLRKQLQFQSERSGRFNGRHVVVWEEERAQALRKRYGLDDDRLVNLLEIVNKLDAMEAEQKQRQEALGL